MIEILAAVITFVLALVAILVDALEHNRKDREEYEHFMNDHPELHHRHTHV